MIYNLSEVPSIFSTYIAEIRDKKIQKDSMRFRENFNRIAEIMAYEVSKTLPYKEIEVETPLGIANVNVLAEQPVLATILRAGLAMHQGFLNVFDRADSAFISAYRRALNEDGEFEIYEGYTTSPSIDDKIVIICDPMLATGASMITAAKALLNFGKPRKLIICVGIATPEAIAFVKDNLKIDYDLYTGAIDEELTSRSYIVPGLGDAGDLAFGEKLQG